MVSKKYLVTGGAGFIGSSLVKKLLEKGHEVRVLDNFLRGESLKLNGVSKDIEMIEGDIRDKSLVEKACKEIDAVCHFAFLNGTEFFYSQPDLVLDIGIKGMSNIIDAAIKNEVREFYLASSSEVYQNPTTIPTSENIPLIIPDVFNPRYSYGGGKILCELMAINYGKKYFNKTIIFRPHNVYGPAMGWEHVIPQFILKMKEICNVDNNNKINFSIQGTGNETRAFIYIDDFTEGSQLALS